MEDISESKVETRVVEDGRECFHLSCYVIGERIVTVFGLKLLLSISQNPSSHLFLTFILKVFGMMYWLN